MLRRVIASAAALLGAVLLLGVGLAPTAGAGSSPLTIYDSLGSARPLHFQMAPKPTILDPLVEVGAGYAEASMSSQGGGASYALSAPAYPGKFGVGAVGCSGLKGWVIAKYPAAGGCGAESHDSFLRDPAASEKDPDPKGEYTTTEVVGMRAEAVVNRSWAMANGKRFELRGGDKTAVPVLEVDGMRTESLATWAPAVVKQRSTAVAEGITLRAGAATISIASVRSIAISSSDGLTGVAEGSLQVGDVTVEMGGVQHRATIDTEGIHIADPTIPREVLASLQQRLDVALENAGIGITLGAPSEIVDGASGETSVGGLIVHMTGTVPTVQYPPEVRPVIAALVNNFPTTCLSDFKDYVEDTPLEPAAATLCFGYGVLPGPGTRVEATLTLATTLSRSAASEGFSFGGGGGDGGGGGFTPPPPGGPIGGFEPGTPFTPPPDSGGPQTQPPPGRQPVLYGLVARMPSGALAGTGAGLLAFAVGLFAAGSLRR